MIIGIGGISRSGQSFLAEKLKARSILAGYSATTIDQDFYVRPEEEIPLIRDHVDWEIPQSIDWERFKRAIQAASKKYDLVIVEGLLVFSNEKINSLYDKRICLSLGRKEFIARKEMDLRWGREPDWYIQYIWEAHKVHGQPHLDYPPDFELNGEILFDVEKVFQGLGESGIQVNSG